MPDFSWMRVVALVAFVGTYLGLALGRLPGFRVDRTGVAIIGAAVMVVAGVLPWEKAVAAVDAHTLVLLFGMMIVAAYLRLSGFFHLVTHWAVRRARGPVGLLAMVVLASGVLSALFVNDVICLVLAPVVLAVVRQLRLPPVPYLLALAMAANVGSVATLTGNPQNMLIGSFSGISYRAFLDARGSGGADRPRVRHRRALAGLSTPAAGRAAAGEPGRQLPDPCRDHDEDDRGGVRHARRVLRRGADRAGGGRAGRRCACSRDASSPRRSTARSTGSSWSCSPVSSSSSAGVEAARLTDSLFALAGRFALYRPAVLTVVTAVLSNLVSNVPAVLLFKTIVPSFGEPTRAWLILAMASTLAGNLTILGSVANLIVVEAAREERVTIGFWEYARVGIPVTLLTLVFGWAILVLLPV